MDKIEEAMEGYWGERCPEYEQDCPACKAWEQFDDMVMTVRDFNEREK